jgi:hypothetical protein
MLISFFFDMNAFTGTMFYRLCAVVLGVALCSPD